MTVPRTRDAIICGTDFTEPAQRAAEVAAALSVALGVPLVLVHAVPPVAGTIAARASRALLEPTRDELRAAAARLNAQGARVSERVHEGQPDEVMVALAQQGAARLIVLGSVGARPATRQLLGTTAERTVEAAPVPTLVVRDAAPFLAWLQGRRPLRVFVGFDFTVSSEAAMEFVRELRLAGRCEVTVGYANWPDERERLGLPADPSASRNPPAAQRAIEQRLRDRVAALLGDGDSRLMVQPARGRADLELLAMARAARADLVVTGTHQQRGLARLVAPSVSRGLLHHARVSVATVPVVTVLGRLPRVSPIRRVLVATDFSPLGNRAVAHALALAPAGGLVRLVHVVHPRALSGGRFESALGRSPDHERHVRAVGRKLQGLIPPDSGAGVTAEAVVVEDPDAAGGVSREAGRFGADVVVMGSHGRTAVGRVVLGSVAQAVMTESERPLFIVRSPRV